MSIINPAYATNRLGVFDLGAFYRSQWVSVEGAPQTISFSAHGAITRKVELGLSVFNDQIGNDINETVITGDFAYLINLNRDYQLSLGLKAGVAHYSANFDNLQLGTGNASTDPIFAQNINSIYANVGIGMFFFNENFYFGLSSPNIAQNSYAEVLTPTNNGVEEIHWFLTSGYVLKMNQNTKFKPAFLLKQVQGAPISMDFTANFLFNDKFELGAAYRLKDAIGGLFRYNINNHLKIGYAYDYTLSPLNEFSNGSHEIFLLYAFEMRGLKDCNCGRFF